MQFLDLPTLLAAPLRPITWLTAGLMPEGSRVLIYGEQGAHKSWLLLHLGLHLAAGRPWLGWPVARSYRVLYLDEEMGRWQLERRVWQLMKGAALPPTIPFVATSDAKFRGRPLDANRVLNALPAGAAPEVVLVDTLRATLIGDENSSADVTAYFDHLEPLWDGGRRTLVVAHHMSKPPAEGDSPRGDVRYRARGSSRIMDHVDVAVALQHPGIQPTTRATNTKGRAAKTIESWGFTLTGEESEPVVIVRDDAAARRLLPGDGGGSGMGKYGG